MLMTCDECGKKFNRKPSRVAKSGAFCSQECFWERGRPTFDCEHCGEKFTGRSPGLKSHRRNRYCSHSCQGAARRLKSTGTKVTSRQGYVLVHLPEHPAARSNGKVAEHRLVMEAQIGRVLFPDEEVHHKNGVRDDNRPENLELWSVSQPAGQRATDKVIHALMILERYAPEHLQVKTRG